VSLQWGAGRTLRALTSLPVELRLGRSCVGLDVCPRVLLPIVRPWWNGGMPFLWFPVKFSCPLLSVACAKAHCTWLLFALSSWLWFTMLNLSTLLTS